MKIARRYVLTLVLALATWSLNAQNWPQWRGPDGNGIAPSGNYPAEIDLQDNLSWKIELPGAGGSTPIVWEDRIIVTSAIGDSTEAYNVVLCYDWEGREIWAVKLDRQIPGKHPRGSGSSSSPVTDGKRIFVLFKTTTLAALDFDGNILWQMNLQDTFGEITFWWDFGTSPVLAEGKVVVAIQNEGDSYILALDQATGQVAWKTDRNYACSPESGQSYTTPLVVDHQQNPTVVVWGADHLTAHDGKSGNFLWSYSGFNPNQKQYWRTIASPVVYQDLVVVPYGRGRYMAAVKLGGDGEMSEEDWLWNTTGLGSDVATPVAYEDRVYIVGFNGKIWCLDIQTGEEQWQMRLLDNKGLFYSSPTLVNQTLYMCSDDGALYVCEIEESGLKVLTHIHFDDSFVATPVLVQNKLLLRGSKFLYCISSDLLPPKP